MKVSKMKFCKYGGILMKKALVFLISYAVALGILIAIINFGGDNGSSIYLVTLLIMAVAGWRFINFITPSFFLWLPLGGWVIYFIIKFLISGMLGIFILPYHVAKLILDHTTD